MHESRHTEIKALAIKFRNAIECCAKDFLPITFRYFPRGSCGDAALLLAKSFEEKKIGAFDYMVGRRQYHSHAWLQNDELIIDITGDQFFDMNHSVFVEKHSPWHNEFRGEAQHVADFNIYDEGTRRTLQHAYTEIAGIIITQETGLK